RIALMVVSHPHPDHALGLASVARAIPVDELWEDGLAGPLNTLVVDAVRANNARATVVTTPTLLGAHAFHGATIDVLAPAPAEHTATYPELEANDNSLVLRVCNQNDCALWPGDVEAAGEDLV